MRQTLSMTLVLIAASAALAQAGDAPAAQTVGLPHAGLSVTLPAQFALQAPIGPGDVLQGVYAADDQLLQMVTVSAFPIARGRSVVTWLEDSYMQSRKDPTLSSVKVLSRAKVTVAGQAGRAYILRLQRGDETHFVAQAAFVRERPNEEADTLISVRVWSRASQKGSLVDRLEAVCQRLELINITAVEDAPSQFIEQPIAQPGYGLAVKAPRGWWARDLGPRVAMGIYDHQALVGQALYAELSLQGAQAGATAASHVDDIRNQLAERRRALEEAGQPVTGVPVLSESKTVKLGGLEAVEVQMSVGENVTVQRFAVRQWEGLEQPWLYTLSVQSAKGLPAGVLARTAEAIAASASLQAPPPPEQPQPQP